MATSKIPSYSGLEYDIYTDVTTNFKFRKFGRVVMFDMEGSGGNYISGNSGDTVCSIPPRFCPVAASSFRDSLNNVRLSVDPGADFTSDGAVHLRETISNKSLRGGYTYMAQF